ncbi:CRISPR-associated endonuclease Cas1 [Spirochaetota bacterium]|nr:CRISPR-associated endonuclease Cas1 [Spirochaetota bacterium]
MSWRTILISTPSYLSLRNRQLVIAQADGNVSVPVADLAFIVIEHKQVRMSVPLLSHLAEERVGVLFLDQEYLPVGVYLPYNGSFEPLRRYELQARLSKPKRKQLWKTIITAKIRNQRQVLDYFKIDHQLSKLLKDIKSGDVSNREAVAARQYWDLIFTGSFLRGERSDFRNIALNYGYAIVRALTARHLAGQGYFTPLGIHHSNRLNSFNLADDFMEPLRPFVDMRVSELLLTGMLRSSDMGVKFALTPHHKQALFEILESEVKLGGEVFNFLKGTETMIESFQDALAGTGKLVIPGLNV